MPISAIGYGRKFRVTSAGTQSVAQLDAPADNFLHAPGNN